MPAAANSTEAHASADLLGGGNGAVDTLFDSVKAYPPRCAPSERSDLLAFPGRSGHPRVHAGLQGPRRPEHDHPPGGDRRRCPGEGTPVIATFRRDPFLLFLRGLAGDEPDGDRGRHLAGRPGRDRHPDRPAHRGRRRDHDRRFRAPRCRCRAHRHHGYRRPRAGRPSLERHPVGERRVSVGHGGLDRGPVLRKRPPRSGRYEVLRELVKRTG